MYKTMYYCITPYIVTYNCIYKHVYHYISFIYKYSHIKLYTLYMYPYMSIYSYIYLFLFILYIKIYTIYKIVHFCI